jgi:hypothetical protein
MERMSGYDCLKKSRGYYMKQMLNVKSCCTVSSTISIDVMVEMQALLCIN